MAKDREPPADFRETLYTIDTRGRRRWVYAGFVAGRYFHKRALVGMCLIVIYLVMPWITISGQQAVWLDIFGRRLFFFGSVFWVTDTIFIFLVLATLAFSLFFFTSLFGRVWCGWACPETVFLELVFRPLERLVLGGPVERRRLDESPWAASTLMRKVPLWAIYALIAWVLAITFLAYFLGAERVLEMIVHSPQENLGPFIFSMIFIGLVFFQFTWFREQFCTVLCPYARFQSVLMDRDSLTVGYDARRGEPRGKVRRDGSEQKSGDCVDCGLCQRVCPTGIDIRNGLQLECIACTQCIDACDSIMDKVGRPRGLIRYATEQELQSGAPLKLIRPRVLVYSAILLILGSILVYRLSHRSLTDAQIIRGALDVPYSRGPQDTIVNHLTLKIANKGRHIEQYELISPDSQIQLVIPQGALSLEPGQIRSVPVFITVPKERIVRGLLPITLTLRSESGWQSEIAVSVLGPE